MPTVATSATAYLTAAELLRLADWRLVADYAADGVGPRPVRGAVADPDHPVGAVVAEALLAASGEVLAKAQAGKRYAPADLAALTGAAAAHLRRVVAGLALLILAGRRTPTTAKADDVPMAAAAKAALDDLASGAAIFGLQEAADAGVEHLAPMGSASAPRGRTVARAARYFGPQGCD